MKTMVWYSLVGHYYPIPRNRDSIRRYTNVSAMFSSDSDTLQHVMHVSLIWSIWSHDDRWWNHQVSWPCAQALASAWQHNGQHWHHATTWAIPHAGLAAPRGDVSWVKPETACPDSSELEWFCNTCCPRLLTVPAIKIRCRRSQSW